MDINLLVLNLGNTRLALGAFAAGQLSSVKHVPHSLKSDWPAAIADVWKQIGDLEDVAIAGASVNPPLEAEVERAVVHEQEDRDHQAEDRVAGGTGERVAHRSIRWARPSQRPSSPPPVRGWVR